MEHFCKPCGQGFSSLKGVWGHECKSQNGFKCSVCDRIFPTFKEVEEHKKAAHRNEKWEVSPKFNKFVIKAENICRDLAIEIIEDCLESIGGDDQLVTNDEGPSSQTVGVWLADITLPEGWRSCLISREFLNGKVNVPEKKMFYSPCGRLFNNRHAVDKFLEDLMAKMKRSSVPIPSSNLRPADLCMPKIEPYDSEYEDVSDAISLSDDDFEEFKPNRKRKLDETSEIRNKKYKKMKLSSTDLDSDYSPSINLAQENILVATYEEWPVPFPGLVTQLIVDTGLSAEVIEGWFKNRTDSCLRILFSSVI